MEDFKIILDTVFSLLSIEIPIFGQYFSIITIYLSITILSIVVNFVVKIFGGEE